MYCWARGKNLLHVSRYSVYHTLRDFFFGHIIILADILGDFLKQKESIIIVNFFVGICNFSFLWVE